MSKDRLILNYLPTSDFLLSKTDPYLNYKKLLFLGENVKNN